MNVLIAGDGKYHPNCQKKFLRNVSRSKSIAKAESGTLLLWLIDKLKTSAEQSRILEHKEVWLRYCTLVAEKNIDVPPSLRSHMTTFKENIAPHVEEVYDFVLLRD